MKSTLRRGAAGGVLVVGVAMLIAGCRCGTTANGPGAPSGREQQAESLHDAAVRPSASPAGATPSRFGARVNSRLLQGLNAGDGSDAATDAH